MIRRTFLKALMASPLVGLVPKAERRRVYMKPTCGGAFTGYLKDSYSPYTEEMARSMSESIDKVILKAIL